MYRPRSEVPEAPQPTSRGRGRGRGRGRCAAAATTAAVPEASAAAPLVRRVKYVILSPRFILRGENI